MVLIKLVLVLSNATLDSVPKVHGLAAFLLPLWVLWLDVTQVGRASSLVLLHFTGRLMGGAGA